jgi:hypothetical protein
MRSRLRELAEQERARRTWITDLAKDRSLFQFDEQQLKGDAATGYDSYRDAVLNDESYKKFEFKHLEKEAALSEICESLRRMIAAAVLNTMRLEKK